jgi:hypothetical protein
VTPRSRIFILVLSHALAVVLGGAVGVWVGFETLRESRHFADEVGMAEWYSAHLFTERLMGDPVAYRNTLLSYLGALNARRSAGGVEMNDHALTVDTVLTETRLALLAESQGNAMESQQYFAKAVSGCAHAWKGDCSEQHLRDVVLRLDRRPTPDQRHQK